MTPSAEKDTARAFRISLYAHTAALGAIAVVSVTRGCARPAKPREIVTYIDVATAIHQSSPAIPDLRAPPREPDPPRPPREISRDLPSSRPREIVAPRQPTEPSRPRQERPPVHQPMPARPVLTPDQIREQLARGFPERDPKPRDDFPFGWYFALVKQTLYEAWTQPSGLTASSGLSVQVRIRVERDGTISRREIIRPSGNAAMDESVRRAIDAVRRLRPLPDAYRGAYRDITIEFELTNLSIKETI